MRTNMSSTNKKRLVLTTGAETGAAGAGANEGNGANDGRGANEGGANDGGAAPAEPFKLKLLTWLLNAELIVVALAFLRK